MWTLTSTYIGDSDNALKLVTRQLGMCPESHITFHNFKKPYFPPSFCRTWWGNIATFSYVNDTMRPRHLCYWHTLFMWEYWLCETSLVCSWTTVLFCYVPDHSGFSSIPYIQIHCLYRVDAVDSHVDELDEFNNGLKCYSVLLRTGLY